MILVIIAFLSGVMSNRPFISNPTVGIENGNTNINNSNKIIVVSKDGKLYVDMTYWFMRYNRNNLESRNLPYTIEHNSINLPGGKVLGIPMEDMGDSWFLDYEYFKKYVNPILPDIIEKNEAEYCKNKKK